MYPIADPLPELILREVVVVRNMHESHHANEGLRPSGFLELIGGIAVDEARPGAFRSEASVVEIRRELGDLVRVRFDGGRRGGPEAVGLVGIVAVGLQGSDEIVGLLGATEIESGTVDPVFDVVT